MSQHSFPKLPPEIRLQIWRYSLPGPRVVSVRCGARSPSSPSPLSSFSLPPFSPATAATATNSNAPPSSLPPWCTSRAAIPASLHVCHESRTEARRWYALMFGLARQPGHVFFDRRQDILYFGPRDGYMASEAQLQTMLALADPDELAQIERVAISETLFRDASSVSPTRPAEPDPAALSLASAPRSLASARSPFSFSPVPLVSVPLLPSSPDPESDRLATHLAADVLHQLRVRLPNLRELIVVPHDETAKYRSEAALVLLPFSVASSAWSRNGSTNGVAESSSSNGPFPPSLMSAAVDSMTTTTIMNTHLARQIQAAVDCVCAAAPGWSPPRWSVMAIRSNGDSSSSSSSSRSSSGGGGSRLGRRNVLLRSREHDRVEYYYELPDQQDTSSALPSEIPP
ncbi:hypothetical protein SPI_00332 [Niveomyces insectorum RCEF 264]|uniref:2EXR domain-containing protein n=1 Tax=Niveomyces insectorum RCEF 264 TaxID=1081102 RepID=A0A168A1R1_9HYPO|nr:hypothetical protein SPI_00332 [Niveomyces insectorum RCEF 264]